MTQTIDTEITHPSHHTDADSQSMLRQRFINQPDLMPAQLASELGIAELDVVAALPQAQRVVFTFDTN